MKNKLLLCCLALVAFTSPLAALKGDRASRKANEPKIFVNNRILATINGKSLSTYDVAKKMDITFYKQYPEFTSSPEARYQYYLMNWQHQLDDLIVKELILADAQEAKITVSSGDLRQEMETMFGPNIIANLDKIGMSYDEAAKIVEGDIIIRRMLSGRVNSKIMGQVTPIKVRAAYETFISKPENIPQDEWKYIVITIKEKDLKSTEASAKVAYKKLQEGVPLAKLVEALKKEKIPGRKGKITVSEAFATKDNELSENYRKVLVHLSPGQYSEPFAVKRRVDKTTVHSILYLVELKKGQKPPFKEMEPKLKDDLLNTAYDKESDAYIDKLKQHFHVRDQDITGTLPANYQPFVLR